MVNSKLIENYKESLNQKYNAVCFDIDGTLTKNNSNKIDERAIEMIADLLKRKIPVVFITGRGETGLNDLKYDIYGTLKNRYNMSINEFRRMYVLTNDGARLFYTDINDEKDIFQNSVYISSQNDIDELKSFNENIIENLNNKSLQNICEIVYSIDQKKGFILNTRIILKNNNDIIVNSVFDIINDVVSKNYLHNLSITRGIYKNRNVIQIGIAKKEVAIEKVEQIIGVPKKSMIRIGDCGDIRGNDFSMLNCEQGYSVDKISDSVDSCFPIINESGEILKGVDATLYLIKNAKILPTVCLESAIKDDYIYKYAKVEEQIIKGRNKHLKKFNEMVNNNFDLMSGINDLFDEFTGSIKIPMYEWELIKDNPLKDFWSTGENKKLFYCVRDDNNYLLRGSKTYYYLLANRESINGKDMTTSDNVINWYYNYLLFFKNAYNAVNNTNDINEKSNKKMALGILDNIRNVILLIINHQVYSSYQNQNVLVNLNSDNNKNINVFYNLIHLADDLMSKICFSENYNISKEKFLDLLSTTYKELYIEFEKTKENLVDKDYSKEYRAYREIDNFSENYITLVLNKDKNKYIENYGVCGLSYGGIELPILYKVINKNIEDVIILKFNKQVSGYTNKQLVDLRKFNINNYGGLLSIGNIKNNNIILLDDNVLTGKTLQLAINTLYDSGFNVRNISIVRYPGTNRIDQMFMDNHSAVDYNLFFDYITGLCFHSPYSWRDENDFNLYEDSLGVFDLNRKKIVECLIKNHDYNEESEVAKYKRRIIK